MNAHSDSPIGVFDSGVGGISTLCELRRLLPHEDFVFRGDSAHAPSGTKSAAEVRRLAEKSLLFLLEKGCKAAVIACNTATAVAADFLREKYPALPIIGIEPAIKPAAEGHAGRKIILLATPLTLRQERISALYHRFETKADIRPVACNGLVELIEAEHLCDEVLLSYLERLFAPFNKEKIAAVVLGCTHYPHIKEALSRVLGDHVPLYDGGEGTARRCLAILKERGLLSDRERNGEISLFNTSPDPALLALSEKLFNRFFL